MIPNLPTDVMDIIFKVSSDTFQTYCKNRLICKGINTLPYQFKLDGSDNVDAFFKYAASRFTLYQLADPKSDEEIAFADQCTAVFSAVSKDKKTQDEAWDSFRNAYKPDRIKNKKIEYKKRLLPRIVAWFKVYKVPV